MCKTWLGKPSAVSSYSALSYICAFLRHYHKEEFLSAIINQSIEDKNKLKNAFKTCRVLGVEVVVPSLETLKDKTYKIKNNKIAMGLSCFQHIKKSYKTINQAAKARPKDYFEFFEVVDRSAFNSGKAEAIIGSSIVDNLIEKSKVKNRTAAKLIVKPYYSFFKKVESKINSHKKWQARKELREQQELLEAEGKDWQTITGKERKVGVGKEPEVPEKFNFKSFNKIKSNKLMESLDEYKILGICTDKYPTEYVDSSDQLGYNHLKYIKLVELEGQGGEKFNFKDRRRFKIKGLVKNFKKHTSKAKKTSATFLLEDETYICNAEVPSWIFKKTPINLDDNDILKAIVRPYERKTQTTRDDGEVEEEVTLELMVYSWEIVRPKEEYEVDGNVEDLAEVAKELKKNNRPCQLVLADNKQIVYEIEKK